MQKHNQHRHFDIWDEAEAYESESVEAFQAALAVRGLCQDVEKGYFRLTSKPDPHVVRPEPVLKKALTRLVKPCHLSLHACRQSALA